MEEKIKSYSRENGNPPKIIEIDSRLLPRGCLWQQE